MAYSLAVCILISVIFTLFPNELLSVFTNDKSIIEQTAPFLLIVSITMFPRAVNNVVGLSIQGMGDTKWMLYGQIFGTIIMVGLSYVLIFVAGFGIYGLFITFLIDECIRALINIFRFWKGREFFFMKSFEKIITKQTNVEEAV
ncbi:MATE family multidrug exporter [compost metagenome]